MTKYVNELRTGDVLAAPVRGTVIAVEYGRGSSDRSAIVWYLAGGARTVELSQDDKVEVL